MSATQQQKADAFRALHEGEPFVIPNPWDAGSARMLEALGFQALATTSSGFAFTLGKLDGEVTLDEVAAHVAALDAATELPVSVDLENGYDASADRAAAAIRRVAEAGAVGGSIEDWDPVEQRIYDFDHAVERVAAAATVAARARLPVHASPRAPRTTSAAVTTSPTRSRACRPSSGPAPTCSTRPGSRRVDEIRAVCDAVSKPVNVLAAVEPDVRRDRRGRRATGQRRRRAHVGRCQGSGRRGGRDARRRLLAARREVPVGDWLAELTRGAARPRPSSTMPRSCCRQDGLDAALVANRPDHVDDPARGRDPRPLELLAVVEVLDRASRRSRPGR